MIGSWNSIGVCMIQTQVFVWVTSPTKLWQNWESQMANGKNEEKNKALYNLEKIVIINEIMSLQGQILHNRTIFSQYANILVLATLR